MPYAFGATVGGSANDDITFSVVTTMFATARVQLIAGWWRWESMTDNNLWSTAGNNQMYVTGGTELAWNIDRATTDALYQTSGLGLVADKWHFIALLNTTLNTGGLVGQRLWVGDIQTPPIEQAITISNAPVGNATGSATFYIGNENTLAFAHNGQIADVSVMVSSAAAGITTNPFGIATHGAITNGEALHAYETLVLPLWLGDPSVMFTRPVVGNLSRYHWSGDVSGLVVGNTTDSATLGPVAPTINGAVWSQVGAPRPSHMPDMLPMRRR